MCVDLPDRHTIHTIGAFGFRVLPALLSAKGFFLYPFPHICHNPNIEHLSVFVVLFITPSVMRI